MHYTRQEIVDRLNTSKKNKNPIIGVATGSGRTARYAEKGAADMILVLNAGHFRLMGLSSVACMLPFENSNRRVLEFGGTEITTIIKKTPVIFGLCATDPTINLENFLDEISAAGFSGINNFPSVGLIDGQYREALEEEGCGYEHEVNAIKIAHDKGLFTVAFVFDEHQALEMAKVGADVICLHFGFTSGGGQGVRITKSIEDCIKLTNMVFRKVAQVSPFMIKMVYGGPISTPEEADLFYRQTSVDGYIGGSSFERIPTENIITEITEQFKHYSSLKRENEFLKSQLDKIIGFDDIVGNAATMKELYHIINKIADKKVNVLIQGESGTGKELIAKAIHKNSNRSSQSFIKINCAAIPANLFESELFGYEKGAFTGAVNQKAGRFELADKGTLFLDEIGELDLSMQPKLLRAIQQQEFERVGGTKTVKVDVRVIAATNRDLGAAVDEGVFRSDLYYRLNVVSLFIPPLKDRKDDITLLTTELLKRINEKFGTSVTRIDKKVSKIFLEHDWPGNVRELENILERSVIMAEGDTLLIDYLPSSYRKVYTESKKKDQDMSLEANEIILIEKVLKRHDWNISQSAQVLGITRKTLQNKIKKHNL